MKNHVSHFEIYADDPDALVRFYSALFDWKIELPMGPDDYRLVRTVDTDPTNGRPREVGGINGGILKRSQKNGPRVIHYITVDELDGAVDKAQSLGARLEKKRTAVPRMGWYALLTDPQGNPFALWQTDSNAI
ncbi:MAG TPA: VOC family protein [Polyangia bacterium]|jgi:predicted enzyme related to lactoylglutathione lyase|nr:VOC family protein [Polyangia bacterium]